MKADSTRPWLQAAALVTGFFVVAASALGGEIYEDLKLLPDGGRRNDEFGHSVGIQNGIVAVGAIEEARPNNGSAYLFDADTGAQFAKLRADDGETRDLFGFSIAIDSGVVAVGAPGGLGDENPSGSTYLFDATTGDQIALLLPNDGERFDNFGFSIAIDNGIIAVGARWRSDNGFNSGAAYLFNASTGDQIAKLLPSDGAEQDYFGESIAIDNGIVAVGALNDDDNGTSSGSAYLFDASTGDQLAKLLPSDGAEGDYFGKSIAIDDGVVAVGATQDDDNGEYSGSAYLFDASTGNQITKLLPIDGSAWDFFGKSIAIDNGIVVVGARGDDDNDTDSGSAYLFDASSGAQIAKLLPSDGARGEAFGGAVAIDKGVVAVGALWDDDNGNNSGSAYVFDTDYGEFCTRDPEWTCDGDVDGDGQVNPVDSGLVQAAFGSIDEQDVCNYDLDCDGQINPVDSGIVQSLFGTCEPPREVCP